LGEGIGFTFGVFYERLSTDPLRETDISSVNLIEGSSFNFFLGSYIFYWLVWLFGGAKKSLLGG
jgi:hypothetical protein